MFKWFLFVVFLLILSCDQPVVKTDQVISHNPLTPKDSLVQVKQIPPEPDVAFLRKRLFDFLESHRKDDFFDTTDNTYAEYWGGAYASYCVSAGHLFNKDQVHAIVTFSDYESAKMYVYIKKNDHWIKIFEDTSIDDTRVYPELKDWNGDGTKDISMPYEKSWSSSSYLWLVDPSGEKIYPIKDFSELDNPVKSKLPGYINASCLHSAGGYFSTYRFDHYILKKTDQVMVWDNLENDNKCVIRYERNGKVYKKIKTNATNAYLHVPGVWKKDVKEYYER